MMNIDILSIVILVTDYFVRIKVRVLLIFNIRTKLKLNTQANISKSLLQYPSSINEINCNLKYTIYPDVILAPLVGASPCNKRLIPIIFLLIILLLFQCS